MAQTRVYAGLGLCRGRWLIIMALRHPVALPPKPEVLFAQTLSTEWSI